MLPSLCLLLLQKCKDKVLLLGVYLSLDDVSDADLGHDGDGNGVDDLTDHSGIRHTGNTAYSFVKRNINKSGT